MARPSIAISRASMEVAPPASDTVSESSAGSLGTNANSIAYLIYANRGDPYSAGFKPPTTRDIPQVKLPRIEHASNSDLASYTQQLCELEEARRLGSPEHDNENNTNLTPLSTIPEPFFSTSFQLDNPRVFDAVIGDEDPNLIQEKLSWYVDVVEAHLTKEIARASTQFFAATAQFGAIEEQTAGTLSRIADFEWLVTQQQEVVQHYMETEQLQRKLKDAESLVACLDLLKNLKESVEILESSINDSMEDVVRVDVAVKALHAARGVLKQDYVDLSSVVAAQSLLERIDIGENRLKSLASSRYCKAMLEGLHADSSVSPDKRAHFYKLAQMALDAATTLNSRQTALLQYQQEINREVKLIVRRNVPATSTGGGPEDLQAMARKLHDLSAEDADKMCTNLLSQLNALFYALKEQDIPELGKDILENAVSSSDSRLSRVFRVRKDPVTSLDVSFFVKFYFQVSEFCEHCSVITVGRAHATELEEFLVAQTKLYIHNLHALVESQLNTALDSDDWRRSEITVSTQLAVNRITGSAFEDPSSWSVNPKSDKEENRSRVEIGSQTFLISKSTAHLILNLLTFLQLTCSLPPSHAVGTSFELLEVLQMFNNRSHQLILGFGATKTAGLKHISVKNLVLCFESLRFVESLLDSIKKCVERHLPTEPQLWNELERQQSATQTILSSFDKVQQQYFDHRNEIHTKLVKLMNDKVSAYSQQIPVTDWSQTPPQANKYMLDLMRQTTTVAHIAQEMMPPSLSLKLIEEIFAVYKPKLLEAYAGVQVSTVAEKSNVLRDLAFFKAKSEVMKGAGNIGEIIYESVNGFVAPELVANEHVSENSHESQYQQRNSLDQQRASYDEADTTLAYEPTSEIIAENENVQQNANDDYQPPKHGCQILKNTTQNDSSVENSEFAPEFSHKNSKQVMSTEPQEDCHEISQEKSLGLLQNGEHAQSDEQENSLDDSNKPQGDQKADKEPKNDKSHSHSDEEEADHKQITRSEVTQDDGNDEMLSTDLSTEVKSENGAKGSDIEPHNVNNDNSKEGKETKIESEENERESPDKNIKEDATLDSHTKTEKELNKQEGSFQLRNTVELPGKNIEAEDHLDEKTVNHDDGGLKPNEDSSKPSADENVASSKLSETDGVLSSHEKLTQSTEMTVDKPKRPQLSKSQKKRAGKKKNKKK